MSSFSNLYQHWWWFCNLKNLGIKTLVKRYTQQYYLLLHVGRPEFVWQSLILTHWGGVTHICISKLTIIGSDNGLSPGWRQAIIWTNAPILLIPTLGIDFSEILSEIYTYSFKKMHLKNLSVKWQQFCLGLNVLTFRVQVRNRYRSQTYHYCVCWCLST